MKTLNVAVVMGGISPEHDISLRSGATVLAHLLPGKFNTKAVVILKNGLWCLSDEVLDVEGLRKLGNEGSGRSVDERGMRPEIALARLMAWGIDVAFLALHGPNGEDGSIQGFFQAAGIPFTGSSVEACAASMNKYTSKVLASWAGLQTPPGILLSQKDWTSGRDRLQGPLNDVGFPAYVKCLHSGSSIGVYRVKSRDELDEALNRGFAIDSDLLVEREIRGREITCGVLYVSEDELKVLPPVEIRPRKHQEFFDFESKYDEKVQAEEICPASIRDEEWDTLCVASLAICRRIGARGICRIDFILNDEGLWFLELNAIPGLTPESIVLKEAEVAGISLEGLMELLIHPAIEAFEKEGKAFQ